MRMAQDSDLHVHQKNVWGHGAEVGITHGPPSVSRLVATIYLRFGDGGNSFMMCVEESMDHCFAAARRLPTT
jgi:hypothetical protein